LSSSQRIHHLDHLRAFALLLGVVYHAAHAWSAQLHVPWIVEARSGSWVLASIEHVSHVFRMPLFYALAGYFAARVIDQRGVADFIANRLSRIVLPLMICLPLLGLALFSVLRQAPPDLSPMLEAMHAPRAPDVPRPPLRVFHLWFLFYLIYFCALAALVRRAPPAGLYRRGWLWWVAPVLLVPALLSTAAPAQAPTELAPQLWPFGYYGLYFAWGYGLYRWDGMRQMPVRSIVAGCLVGTPLYVWAVAVSAHPTALAFAQAWVGFFLVNALWYAGQRWFDRSIPWARYLSDASYWIYLVHLPVVLWLQVQLTLLGWPAGWAFLACVVATMAVCLLTYAVCVRRTVIGVLLNGRRR
jgi:glucan biosynthesis protein C